MKTIRDRLAIHADVCGWRSLMMLIADLRPPELEELRHPFCLFGFCPDCPANARNYK